MCGNSLRKSERLSSMKYWMIAFVAFFIVSCVCCRADNARFCMHVVDERTGLPLSGVRFKGVFIERFSRWENAVVDHDFTGETNQEGDYAAAGKTNCGEAGFCLCGNNGFYDTKFVKVPFDLSCGKPMFAFQWWKPDNQVITVELQRVEHPIPLWVKDVNISRELRQSAGFGGTNDVRKYDLVLGDWLPPAGHGKVADLIMEAHSNFVERVKGGIVDFDCYERSLSMVFPGEGNGIAPIVTKPTDGIKVRQALASGYVPAVVKRFGQRKSIRGVVISPKLYSDEDPNRCYVFRIRSRYDKKGNLVEAYYGKIYGDFNFSKVWYYGERQFFLYYLNPTSLDRNLEWDMKNNLCPNPGSLGQPQP